jgi:hypothetical protein
MPLADQTAWHRVVGIICIVFGGGALFRSIFSTLGQQTERSGADLIAYQALMSQWSGKLMAMAGAAALSALILAVGGLLLLLKKRKSVMALKIWVGIKIVFLLVTIPIQAGFLKAIDGLHYTGALAGEGAEFAASDGRIWIVLKIAVEVLWSMLLPTFILIWFSRKKIREQVAFWD